MRPARPCSRVLFSALALLILAQPALAQWKWRDARGNVTVSDLPPPREVSDNDILQRPAVRAVRPTAQSPTASAAASAPAAAAASAPVDAELQARKRAAEQEQAAKAKAEAQRQQAARQENCRNARENLAAMDSGQRIVRMNKQGEREFIDDRQRADEARRARSVIASDCS